MAKAKRTKKIKIPTANADDLPATRKMLYLVRDELKSDIQSVRSDLGTFGDRFESMDSKFDSMDSRFDSMDSRFDSMDSRIDSLKGEISSFRHEIRSEISRLALPLEEQNANNRLVLEGHQALWQRQDRIEKYLR